MIVKTLPMVRLQLYTRPTLRVPVRDEELQVAAVVRLAPAGAGRPAQAPGHRGAPARLPAQLPLSGHVLSLSGQLSGHVAVGGEDT